jgi:hypothetical protein
MKGMHMKAIKKTKRTAEVYGYRFDDGYEWAEFTLCEETGSFAVSSSRGDFSFTWAAKAFGKNKDGTPKTLKQFLAGNNDPDYVVRKFQYNHSVALEKKLDGKAMLVAIRKAVLERHKEHRSEGVRVFNECRDLWDMAEEWTYEIDDKTTNEAIESCPDKWCAQREGMGLDDFLGDVYMWLEYRESWTAEYLRTKLLPFFFAELRAELEGAS